MNKRILFISHDASRTGAPMVLLHLLKWLKSQEEVQLEVLFAKGGELHDEFNKYAKTHVLSQVSSSRFKSYTKKVLEKFFNVDFLQKKLIAYLKTTGQFDLIYANTAATIPFLSTIKKRLSAPVILHLHEYRTAIVRKGSEGYLNKIDGLINHYIACSDLIKNNLIDYHKIQTEKVTRIYEFVEPKQVQTSVLEIKQQLGISDSTLIVGGSGTFHWRKGVDFFIFTAKKVLQETDKKVCFVWLGGDLDAHEAFLYNSDIISWGLEDKIKLIGSKPNPVDYMNAFDVFAMTSRVDPFPLVCIETALLGKPIICFDKNVGSAEFIDNQVPYLDIDAMSNHLITLIDDATLRSTQGTTLQQRAQEFTIDKIGPQVLSLIEEVAAK